MTPPVWTPIWILGEALMDCVAQANGDLRPLIGGSPFNLARAVALRCGARASVGYINRLSVDSFGDILCAQFAQDDVSPLMPRSRWPTSLAVVQIKDGQPSYGFYREAVADRDYTVDEVLTLLKQAAPGVLHTGSLALVPPEHGKVIAILQVAKAMGWTISIDVNLRPQMAPDLNAYIAAVNTVAALADWLKASDEDLVLLGFNTPKRADAPRIAQHFTAQGIGRLALTFGAEGAWLSVDGITAEQDVPQVTVIDTVGAGDTFWGNCVADWVLQPADAAQRVAATLRLATQAAAINCTRAGCQPPREDELLTL
jgi:fructokinase